MLLFKKLLFAYGCALICAGSFAQPPKFDSLKALLPKTTVPEKRAALLIDIAKSIYYSIPDSSIGYCEQAEKLSKNNHLDVQEAYALHCECRYLLLKGDLKSTIEKLNKAISLFEKHKEQKGLAKAYSLKSIALGRLGNHGERLEHLIKAKAIYLDLKDDEGLSGVLLNLTNAYVDFKKYDQAIQTLEERSKLILNDSSSEFFAENHYGHIYYDLNKTDEAIFHYKKSTEIARRYKMLDSEITGLTHLAECYQKKNNHLSAKGYYFQALDLARQNHLMVEEADALKGLTDLYEAEQDFKNGYFSLKQYKTIQDSIFTIEKMKSINNIEHKLQLTEKEKIIAEQNLSLEKEKVELASSKNKGLMLAAGLVIIGIAFLFLFYYNRRTTRLFSLIKRQKAEVEVQKEIIEEKNREVTDSITYARYIQGSMLPSEKTMNALFSENFVLYKPKDIVAGDFYWTEAIDGKTFLLVGDCTGHGVPGAMVSIVACNAINRAVKEFKLTDPSLILDKVNELMQETFSKSDYEVKDGMDAALCVINHKAMKMYVAGAYNPVWIVSPPAIKTDLWEESWNLSQITTDKQPVGKFEGELIPFQQKIISIEKGEMIYLFTDGYADQFGGPKGKKFKHKQFQELLTKIAQLPARDQKTVLDQSIESWRGNLDQVDDICVIGIRV